MGGPSTNLFDELRAEHSKLHEDVHELEEQVRALSERLANVENEQKSRKDVVYRLDTIARTCQEASDFVKLSD
jgi:uncharacterized coiled-coil DUF342 family protein